MRPWKPEGLTPYNDGQGGWLLDNGVWHEYTGQSIYGDYAVDFDETTSEAEVTETFAHVPGIAQYDYAQPVGSRRQNLRGNLVGTTERMVGESGMITQRSVYTAFGELAYQAGVGQTRYGYCGAWGYESAGGVSGYVDPLAELGWLHVGERYYDPAAGRFMQRDPIGIRGGFNFYEYSRNNPVSLIDPSGLLTIGIEIEGSANLIFFGIKGSLGLHWGFSWCHGLSFGATGGIGGNLGLGLGASLGPEVVVTTAHTVQDLSGPAVEINVNGGPVNGEVFFGSNRDGTPYVGGAIGGGLGINVGINAGLTGTGTTSQGPPGGPGPINGGNPGL